VDQYREAFGKIFLFSWWAAVKPIKSIPNRVIVRIFSSNSRTIYYYHSKIGSVDESHAVKKTTNAARRLARFFYSPGGVAVKPIKSIPNRVIV
jgi:hypothetical protein